MGSTLATSLMTGSFCPGGHAFSSSLGPGQHLSVYNCVVCLFTPGQVSSAVVLAQGQGLRLGEEQTVRLPSTLWDLSPTTARQSSRHPTRRPALGLCHCHSPGKDLRWGPEVAQEGTAGP